MKVVTSPFNFVTGPYSPMFGLYLMGGLIPGAKGLKNSKLAQSHPQTAERGAYVPLVLGRRQVGSTVLWVGDRKSKKKKSGGGGKGPGGSSSSSSTITYKESAWHGLCVGPARAIYNVLINDEMKRREVLATGTDSGDFINPFYVFWGEQNQPVSDFLADESRVGIASRWPFLCYVIYKQLELGGSPTWPRITCEVEVLPSSPLTESAAWMEETEEGRGDWGVNAAHAIWDIWTSPFPRGVGGSTSDIDYDRIEGLGEILQEEHLPVNIIARDGASALETIGQIISDLGINLGQIGRQIVAFPIRAGEDLPDLTDVVISNLPEREIVIGDSLHDKVQYSFTNPKLKWSEDPIENADDGRSLERGRVNTERESLAFITNREVAAKIADIKSQSVFGEQEKVTFDLVRVGRLISPGMAFTVDGIRYRVAPNGVQINTKGRGAKITAYVDAFDVDGSNPDVDPPGGGTGDVTPVEDLWFDFMEIPAGLTTSAAAQIGIMRWRGSPLTANTLIWISSDGVTYDQAAETDAVHTGGILNEGIPASATMIIEEGPTFDPTGVLDIEDILDLSSDEAGWRLGKQVAVINGEIFYLKAVTIIDPTHYRLDGLIRARFDTRREEHQAGDRVVIISDFEPIGDPRIVPGAVIWLKVQPSIGGEYVPLGDVDPVIHRIEGRKYQPLSPSYFKGRGATPGTPQSVWDAGDDIDFAWAYRVVNGGGNACGEGPAGLPLATDSDGDLVVPAADGPGRLEIRLNLTYDIVSAANGAHGTVRVAGDHAAVLNFPGKKLWIEGGTGTMNGDHTILSATYDGGDDETIIITATFFAGATAVGKTGWIRWETIPLTKGEIEDDAYTLTNAALVSLFGGEPPEFEARLLQLMETPTGGVSVYESAPARRVMTRR